MTDTTHEAPERMWIDPDILPSEWHKQYHCDVEYVRIDLVEAAEQQGYASAMEAERKLHEGRIEELEAKLAKQENTIAAGKEMYETAMLTGGGSPVAWTAYVKARNIFGDTLAELSS